MKVSKTSSSTLFQPPTNSTSDILSSNSFLDIESLANMQQFTFVNHLSSHPDVLELALNNDQLIQRFDVSTVKALATTNGITCDVLLKSKKFDNEPLHGILMAQKKYFTERKSISGASLKK